MPLPNVNVDVNVNANVNVSVNVSANANAIPHRPQRASRGIHDRPWRVKGRTSETSPGRRGGCNLLNLFSWGPRWGCNFENLLSWAPRGL